MSGNQVGRRTADGGKSKNNMSTPQWVDIIIHATYPDGQRESRTKGQRLSRDDNLRLRPTINVYFS